jgi:hypothetical protein
LQESLREPDKVDLRVYTWARPSRILKNAISQTYEGERSEMESVVTTFPGDNFFYQDHFWPLYLDTLLLRRANVRAYCREHQFPQVCEVKGFMREDNTAQPLLAAEPASPTAPSTGQDLPCTVASPSTPPSPRRGTVNYEVTQKKAAELCEVSIRTIGKWEGGNPPNGYPGRSSMAALVMFANKRRELKVIKRGQRAINRATPSGDMSEYPEDDDME